MRALLLACAATCVFAGEASARPHQPDPFAGVEFRFYQLNGSPLTPAELRAANNSFEFCKEHAIQFADKDQSDDPYEVRRMNLNERILYLQKCADLNFKRQGRGLYLQVIALPLAF